MAYRVMSQLIPSAYTGYSWSYQMGWKMTFSQGLTVTKLGGYFSGPHTVKLYNSSYQIIAQATVNSSNSWAYTDITPVQVSAGTYYLIVDVAGIGGAYFTISVPQTIGAVRVENGVYQSGAGFDSSHSNANGVIYGIPDLEVSEQADWKKSADTQTTVTENLMTALSATRSHVSLLELADQVKAQIVDHGFGVEAFGAARFDVIIRKQTAADVVSMADALRKRARPRAVDAAGLTDQIRKTARLTFSETVQLLDGLRKLVRLAVADTAGLVDVGNPRLAVQFKTVADAISLTDAYAALVQAIKGDPLDLTDLVKARARVNISDVQDVNDRLAKDTSKALSDAAAIADAVAAAVAMYKQDLISLADQLAIVSKLSKSDLLPAVEQIAAAVARGEQNEAIGLADALIKQIGQAAADTLALADALDRLIGVPVAAEILALDDALRKHATLPTNEILANADNLAKKIKAVANEAAPASDRLARLSVAKDVNDQAAILERLAASVRARLTDIVDLADLFAVKLSLGSVDEAIGLADELRNRATLAINDIAGSVNRMPAFDQWTLYDRAYVEDGVLHLPKYGSRAVSPLVVLGRENWCWSAEYFSNDPSPYASFFPDSGFLQGSAYYNIEGEPARNASNYTGNGNAQKFPVGEWTRKYWSYLGGNNVAFMTINVRSSSSYTPASFSVRNPMLTVDNTWQEFVPPGVLDGLAASVGAAPGSDTATLAEHLVRLAGKAAGELLGALDAVRTAVDSSLTDAGSASDAFAITIRKTVVDTANLADQIRSVVTAQRPDLAVFGSGSWGSSAWNGLQGDPVGVSDSISMSIGLGVLAQDLIALADALRMRMQHQADDPLQMAEALAKAPGMRAGDQSSVSDAAEITAGRGVADLLGVVDDLIKSVAAVMADQAEIASEVRLAVAKLAADLLSLADASELTAGRTLADILELSDNELQKVTAELLRSSGLSMQDLLAKYINNESAVTDAPAVSDHLVVALLMARQAADLIGAVDAARMKIGKLVSDVLATSDAVSADMDAARAEAFAVAETLGLAAGKQLPADAVGVIDELALRAALGLDADHFTMTDKVSMRRVRMLQQVFINGVQVPVAGLRVHHSASERVSTCSFTIPNPSSQVLSLAKQRAEVRVYLLDGDGTDYFAGRIVGNPVRARGSVSTELQITADDWTAAAQDIYVSEVYTAEDGTLDQLLKDLWGRYFERAINLSQVVATSKTVDLIAFNYDTLFEATEKVAQLLGWVWFVEWDGADLVLRFFPPSAAVQPVTLSRENRNIEAGTARFGQSDKLVNSVYVFGGEGKSAPHAERILADGERLIYRLSYKPHRPADGSSGVQVSVGGTPQTVGIYGLHEAGDFDVLLDFHQQHMIFRSDNKPAKDAVIEGVYSYVYPILVHLSDDQSIAAFGKSEAVLTDSRIRDVRIARELGRSTLRSSAWPQGYGSCEVFVPGLRAGQFVTVDLPAYSAHGLFEILEIEKWVQAGTVRRRLTLNMADTAETRIAERLRAFAQRLASLEASQRTDDPVVQRVLRDPANLAVTVIGKAVGHIRDNGESGVAMTDQAIMVWATSGAAHIYSHAKVQVSDAGAARIGPDNNSIGQVNEYVTGGISFFGVARFGEKPFGIGVSA